MNAPDVCAAGNTEGGGVAEVERNRRIVAEYALWKRNAPFLYDMLMVCASHHTTKSITSTH